MISLPLDVKDERYNPNERYVIYPENNIAYHSDDNLQLVEVDIKSAFPTFMTLFYKDRYPEVVKKIEETDDKLTRNIIISTQANEVLKELHYLSKLFLLSFLQTKLFLVDIIELKKDGGVFIIPKHIINTDTQINHYQYPKVIYKIKLLKSYYRFHSTSLYKYQSDNNVTLKGKLKHIPNTILQFYKDEISKSEILDKYSDLYHSLLWHTNVIDKLRELYICHSQDDDRQLILTSLHSARLYEEYKRDYDLYRKVNTDLYYEAFIKPYLLLSKDF